MTTPEWLFFDTSRGLIPRLSQIPKSKDVQVHYTKWHRIMHIVSPLHLWIPSILFHLELVESVDAKPGIT